jgi:hypothetical protein
VTTYWPGRQKILQRHGSIPLNDDRDDRLQGGREDVLF